MLRYRNEGKYWEWTGYDFDRYFCTNDEGEGIFFVDLCANSRRQLEGTCQFSLSGLKDPKAKIRKWMKATGRA